MLRHSINETQVDSKERSISPVLVEAQRLSNDDGGESGQGVPQSHLQ